MAGRETLRAGHEEGRARTVVRRMEGGGDAGAELTNLPGFLTVSLRPDRLRIELRLTSVLKTCDDCDRMINLSLGAENRKIDRKLARLVRFELWNATGFAFDAAVGWKPRAGLQSRHVTLFNRRRILP